MSQGRSRMDYLLNQGEMEQLANHYIDHYMAQANAGSSEAFDMRIVRAPDGAGVYFASPDLMLRSGDSSFPLQNSLRERILDCASFYLALGIPHPRVLRIAMPVNHNNVHWTGAVITLNTFGEWMDAVIKNKGSFVGCNNFGLVRKQIGLFLGMKYEYSDDELRNIAAVGIFPDVLSGVASFSEEKRRQIWDIFGYEPVDSGAERADKLFSNLPVEIRHYDSLNSDGDFEGYFERVQRGSGILKNRLVRVRCSLQRGMTCGDHTVLNLFTVAVLNQSPPRINLREAGVTSADLRQMTASLPRNAKCIRVELEDLVIEYERTYGGLSDDQRDLWTLFVTRNDLNDPLQMLDEAIGIFKEMKIDSIARKVEAIRSEERLKLHSPQYESSLMKRIFDQSGSGSFDEKEAESSLVDDAIASLSEFTGKVVEVLLEIQRIVGEDMPSLIDSVLRPQQSGQLEVDTDALNAYIRKHPGKSTTPGKLKNALQVLSLLMSGEDDLTKGIAPEDKRIFADAALVYVSDTCVQIRRQSYLAPLAQKSEAGSRSEENVSVDGDADESRPEWKTGSDMDSPMVESSVLPRASRVLAVMGLMFIGMCIGFAVTFPPSIFLYILGGIGVACLVGSGGVAWHTTRSVKAIQAREDREAVLGKSATASLFQRLGAYSPRHSAKNIMTEPVKQQSARRTRNMPAKSNKENTKGRGLRNK